MPRGGRSSSRRSVPKKTSKSTTTASASSTSSVPVRSERGSGGFVANVAGAVADGICWGTGNAIAHRAMDAIMGPRTVEVEHVPAPAPAAQVASSAADKCPEQNKAFNDCINTSGNDISRCQFYMDILAECRRSGSATSIGYSF